MFGLSKGEYRVYQFTELIRVKTYTGNRLEILHFEYSREYVWVAVIDPLPVFAITDGWSL